MTIDGDKVVLTDLANWTASVNPIVINGHTYTAYTYGGAQLLIDQALLVVPTA